MLFKLLKYLTPYHLGALSLFKVKFPVGLFCTTHKGQHQMMAKITLTADLTLNSKENISTDDHLAFSILQSGYYKIN